MIPKINLNSFARLMARLGNTEYEFRDVGTFASFESLLVLIAGLR